jgi:hypothetical protein
MKEAKSFYIFDFDDNIINTGSITYVYHKETGEEVSMSSAEFVEHRKKIGIEGPFENYFLDYDDGRSFKRFRDDPKNQSYPFLEDLKEAVQKKGWEGPSWQRFVKAVQRDRTISIITARGHHPDRIQEGLQWLAQEAYLPKVPSVHSIYAVTSQVTKNQLRWTGPDLIASLKKQALHHFMESVYNDFGHEPAHRFGFSDDDPKNIASTRSKFLDLKQRNPHHSFFLYEARPKEVLEEEVHLSHNENH